MALYVGLPAKTRGTEARLATHRSARDAMLSMLLEEDTRI
jgi:hypothetical protein